MPLNSSNVSYLYIELDIENVIKEENIKFDKTKKENQTLKIGIRIQNKRFEVSDWF